MEFSRREFIVTSAVGAIALGSGIGLLGGNAARAAGTIRVGLVGCGRRGTGTALNAAAADPGVRIVALADTFQDQADAAAKGLQAQLGAQFDAPSSRVFAGFDAFDRLLSSGVDVVILATPPHFRPAQIEAAIRADKHVFAEKPVAVDVPGVKRVLAAASEASRRGLSLISGYCYRYDHAMRETIARIQQGAIGQVRTAYCAYNKGSWDLLPRKSGWSDMEFQIRNYRHSLWLQGDITLELSHNIDKVSWALGEYPVRAWGMGGRQAGGASACYDHHSIVYEYASGVRLTAYNRAIQNAEFENCDFLYGSKGIASLMDNEISGDNLWTYGGARNDMYQTQHDELMASIRSGRPINDGEHMAKSTFMGILGRWASYTGKKLEWDQVWKSTQVLGPAKYDWGAGVTEQIAIPGRTRLV